MLQSASLVGIPSCWNASKQNAKDGIPQQFKCGKNANNSCYNMLQLFMTTCLQLLASRAPPGNSRQSSPKPQRASGSELSEPAGADGLDEDSNSSFNVNVAPSRQQQLDQVVCLQAESHAFHTTNRHSHLMVMDSSALGPHHWGLLQAHWV